ncbi:hypothetical protein AB0H86_08570 [Streptomyces sp. NPDC050997]|uniref:hypothetical protein n=1 Tax=Streptomyces sp. NPDC050997 TaxID=3155519 RepID=UPI003434F5FD
MGRKSRELRQGPAFDGRKDSLFRDHHIHGNEGTRFSTRGKAVPTRRPDPADAPSGVDLGFPRTL